MSLCSHNLHAYAVEVPGGKNACRTSVVPDFNWPGGFNSPGDRWLCAQSAWCAIPRHSDALLTNHLCWPWYQDGRLSCIHGKFLVFKNYILKLCVADPNHLWHDCFKTLSSWQRWSCCHKIEKSQTTCMCSCSKIWQK